MTKSQVALERQERRDALAKAKALRAEGIQCKVMCQRSVYTIPFRGLTVSFSYYVEVAA